MSRVYEDLPEASPDLEPIAPHIRARVLAQMDKIDENAARTRKNITSSLVTLLILAILFAVVRARLLWVAPHVPPAAERIAAPPKAKPTPVPAPAPVAPPLSPRADNSTTQYVKDPHHPPHPDKVRIINTKDGSSYITDWPEDQ